MSIKEIGKRPVIFTARSLLILAAILTGPAWFSYTVNAGCGYSCGIGKSSGGTSSGYDSACGDQGGICYSKFCGVACKNSQGQSCGPPNSCSSLPSNCECGIYLISECGDFAYMIPCGCDQFSSH